MTSGYMRAIRIHRYGGAEELKLEQTPRPTPQVGEALLRVHAVGVNPIDWKIRQGLMKAVQPVTFPFIPGIEVAGVIAELGPGVTAFEVGQAVFGKCANGGYAEYVAVPVEELALSPRS